MSSNWVLYENITEVVTLSGALSKNGRNIKEEDLGIIQNASVVVDNSKNEIVWIGKTIPDPYRSISNRYYCEGEVWFPEFVECHTHLIFGGQRHHDYALRCQGKTYLDIAKEGGGIVTTVKATREMSKEELVEKALVDLDYFERQGIGAIEIKSGYGLTLESEIKILESISELEKNSTLHLVPTLMAAHAIPAEFKGKVDDYVSEILNWTKEIAQRKLAKFFDVFIEENYFNISHAKKLCENAKELGFKLKLHVDQFTSLGGVELGLELGATSLDHLDVISEKDIQKLSQSKTVAVLLPGASLFTGHIYPPARKMLDSGVQVALSTDYNPGTCPSRNLALMTTLACSQMKMTLPEAICAITYNAACALGIENKFGVIAPHRPFRVFQFRANSYEELPYRFGEVE